MKKLVFLLCLPVLASAMVPPDIQKAREAYTERMESARAEIPKSSQAAKEVSPDPNVKYVIM